MQEELSNNFQEVKVEVVDCPNLAEEPFNLAGSGLGGSPTLLESGGFINLLEVKDRLKVYNLKTLSEGVMGKKEDLFVLGSGAGPVYLNGKNCEIIVNMKVAPDGDVINKSYEAVVEGEDDKFHLRLITESDMFSYVSNLFLSEGKRDKVLRVHCKKRIGSLSFVESIRVALLGPYQEKCVGLGGIFLMKNGTFTHHLANSKQSSPSAFKLANYEIPGPFNAVGTLLSQPYVSFFFDFLVQS